MIASIAWRAGLLALLSSCGASTEECQGRAAAGDLPDLSFDITYTTSQLVRAEGGTLTIIDDRTVEIRYGDQVVTYEIVSD